jgi:hypothetical protein
MNFLQKKLWIAWSKFRFLRLPVERRVRLEVTTDGRHITFLLVSLYEAGYGVQVFGSQFVFRELICLRKSAPIPFMYGGKERECGISITDKSGFNHGGHGEHGGGKRLQLDYDYFSGLMERGEPRNSRIDTKSGKHGEAQGTCAGAEFSNPFTSELARDSENTSPTRSASEPASSAVQPRTDIGGLISDKSEVAKALDSGCSSLDSASLANAGDSRSESSGIFEGPSATSLVSGTSKNPPDRAPGVPASDSSFRVVREFRGKKSEESKQVPCSATGQRALRAPYFMHPSVYHRGLHKRRSPSTALDSRLSTLDSAAKQRRRFRIGFFGTHDREFYTQHYHFPGMNRCEILEVFLQNFGERITHLRGFPRDWEPCEIAVSIDGRGGDRQGKSFLSQDHYFEALRECDFVLSPPGICMPISHNLIEAMFCGAVPITNAGAFMAEPLSDGETCLEFKDVEGLVSVIKRVLAMDEGELARMRNTVRDYYNRFLDSKAILENLIHTNDLKIIVNAEEKSVPMVYPDFVWPPL